MTFLFDPLWWLLFMGLGLSLTLYGTLSLEGTLAVRKTAPLERLYPLKYLSLFSTVVLMIFILRFFGCTALLIAFLGSAILCLFVLLTRLDRNGILLAQNKRCIANERCREAFKKRHIEEVKKHLQATAVTEYRSVTDEDLDDYFELLSCAWSLQDILPVMKDRTVFEYYFTNKHLSKWEILKAVQALPAEGRRSPDPAGTGSTLSHRSMKRLS